MTRLVLAMFAALLVAAPHSRAQQGNPALDKLFARAQHKATVAGDLKGAIEDYKRIVATAGKDRTAAAQALLRMAEAYQKLGDAEAQRIYQRLVREFGDQKEAVATARARLATDSEATANPSARLILRQRADGPVIGPPSLDGRYFAGIIPNGNLILRDNVTGTIKELTNRPNATTFAEEPVFSADGKSIVFAWFAWPEDEWQLRSINLDGSNNRLIAKDVLPEAVSPDGTYAAFVGRSNGAQQIALVGLTKGDVRPLKSVEWRRPNIGNFTPDGRSIVYSAQVQQGSLDREISVLAADGSRETVLVGAPGLHDDPFFTPDGSHVVFTSNRSGRWDLWAVPVRDGKAAGPLQVLKADIGAVRLLGFDRSATLYFHQRLDETEAYTAQIDGATRKAIGEPERVSDRFIGKTAAPRWSPDGRSVAYLVLTERPSRYGTEGDVTVVVRDIAAATTRSFVVPFNAVANAHNFRWFPDGRSLLFVEWGPQRARTFRRMDVATGELRLLFQVPVGRPESFAITSDGQAVLYTLPAQQQNALIRRDLASGEETTLFRAPGNHGLSLSPDGRSVATIKNVSDDGNRWSVWITDLASGESREVWKPSDRRVYPGPSAWDPSGRGLYVTAQESPSDPQVWFVPADGSAAVMTGISMPVLGALSVHPDGRRIGFTGGRSSDEVWSIKNLLSPQTAKRN